MTIELLTSGALSAKMQMQIDQELLDTLSSRTLPLLRTYSWQRKSITYGYFIDIDAYIDVEKAEQLGYDIARRPTGGGLLFHGADFSFTLALAASHPKFVCDIVKSYQVINQALLRALQLPDAILHESEEKTYRHLCMATPTRYDLIWQKRKIGGSAQRRTKQGLIHQSSLFLQPPDWQEVGKIYRGPEVEIAAMQAHAAVFVPPKDLLHRFMKELESYFGAR